ncbi:bifunctional nicotinamidase/pyrazinamidase [Aureimonas sp. ME7]|uniref:bifunctional nicotinamidase/pyrazinamidase n=1 Tax=Aureimonas sp. ME7 TaxID=2744252 RepID=UPI0015FDF5AD|nr:bifunctional nicotinamidase/pyrazinamidase [Aureimonas sp. ME7]
MTIRIEERDALIVVDVQNDFCPGGALAVAGGDSVVPIVDRLMERFPIVVLTQDWHPPGHVSFASTHAREAFTTIELAYGTQVLWPDHCIQGSSGAEFHPSLRIARAQAVIRKGYNGGIDSYSGFQEADRTTQTGLTGYLRERGAERVFVCGLATDYCVAWTAYDAKTEGWPVMVVEDACRAIDLDGSLEGAFAEMERRGIDRITAADLD